MLQHRPSSDVPPPDFGGSPVSHAGHFPIFAVAGNIQHMPHAVITVCPPLHIAAAQRSKGRPREIGTAFDVGGDEGIRTPDPFDANEVRYRTALHPLGLDQISKLLRVLAPPFQSPTARLGGSAY